MQQSKIRSGDIVSHYVVQKKIGEGGYGAVYSVINQEDNQKYAMKIEFLNANKKGLTNEIRVLYELRDCPYLPRLIDDGAYNDFRYYIMDLFGPSIHKIQRATNGNKLPLDKTLKLGLEMLHAIEALHKKGFVHRDIKPSNFLINQNSDNNVTLIDFGLAEKYLEGKKFRPYLYHTGFSGTPTYASLNVHHGIRYSPRDDLLSWFYSLIEIAKGKLPWDKSMSRKQIQIAKEFTPSMKICSGLPFEFDQIYLYLKKLKYNNKPDYKLLEKLLNNAMKKVEKKQKQDESKKQK